MHRLASGVQCTQSADRRCILQQLPPPVSPCTSQRELLLALQLLQEGQQLLQNSPQLLQDGPQLLQESPQLLQEVPQLLKEGLQLLQDG